MPSGRTRGLRLVPTICSIAIIQVFRHPVLDINSHIAVDSSITVIHQLIVPCTFITIEKFPFDTIAEVHIVRIDNAMYNPSKVSAPLASYILFEIAQSVDKRSIRDTTRISNTCRILDLRGILNTCRIPNLRRVLDIRGILTVFYRPFGDPLAVLAYKVNAPICTVGIVVQPCGIFKFQIAGIKPVNLPPEGIYVRNDLRTERIELAVQALFHRPVCHIRSGTPVFPEAITFKVFCKIRDSLSKFRVFLAIVILRCKAERESGSAILLQTTQHNHAYR